MNGVACAGGPFTNLTILDFNSIKLPRKQISHIFFWKIRNMNFLLHKVSSDFHRVKILLHQTVFNIFEWYDLCPLKFSTTEIFG